MKNFWSTLLAVVIGLTIVFSISFYLYNQAEEEKEKTRVKAEIEKQEKLHKLHIQNMSDKFILLLNDTAKYHYNCDYTLDSNPETWIYDPECVRYQSRRDEVVDITNNNNAWLLLNQEMETNTILKEKYDQFLKNHSDLNERVMEMYENYNEIIQKYRY